MELLALAFKLAPTRIWQARKGMLAGVAVVCLSGAGALGCVARVFVPSSL